MRPWCVALGDLHLDQHIWKKYRQIEGDSALGLSSAIDVVLEKSVPFVMVGDIFDSVDPSPYVVRLFREQMDRCERAGVPVYAIQGNHDRRPVPWYTAVHGWPQHIGDGRPVCINGKNVVGFDYAFRDRISNSLAELSTLESLPEVLFLHQAVKQALRFEGQWNCDLEWCPEGIPLVVMGDIHTEWESEFRSGQRAYYTAASHPRNISEIGPKSCLVVNEDLSVVREPILYRSIRCFSVTNLSQLEDLKAWLASLGARTQHQLPPVAFVTYVAALSASYLELCALYEEWVVLIGEAVADVEELEFIMDSESPVVDSVISTEALLEKLVDKTREPEVYTLVLSLLDRSHNVLDALREAREHFLNA